MNTLFNHYQKIIVKVNGEWSCGVYSHFSRSKGKHILINGTEVDENNVLNYEEYNYLIGTNMDINVEPEFNENDILYVTNNEKGHNIAGTWAKRDLYMPILPIDGRGILTKDYKIWKYAMTKSDFENRYFENIYEVNSDKEFVKKK